MKLKERLNGVYNDYVLFLNFDGTACWDKEPIKIKYDDITSISFGNRYVEFMSKYVHNQRCAAI